MKAADVMADVVADIVTAIEAGAGTWSIPWRMLAATGIPTNAITGNRYTTGARGIFEVRECSSGAGSRDV